MSERMSRLAERLTELAGSWPAMLGAVAVVLAWALTGPLFGFSSAWQLVINTGTTIVTFVMVFFVQHSTNRGNRALHTKIDGLVRAVEGASDRLVGIEDQSDRRIRSMQEQVRTRAGEGDRP